MRRLILSAVLLTFAAASAQAAPSPCFGLSLAEAWKQGYEAYTAGRFDEAQDVLEPLAENGFAPAQWLVGRMVSQGQGATKDVIAGLVWLKLAGLSQIRQARPDASKLESQLDMTGFEQVRRRQESWQPKLTHSCSEDTSVPTKIGDTGNVKKGQQQLQQWWKDFVIDASNRNPQAMLYLLTLPAVVFVGDGANASVIRHKGMTILLVNEKLSERTMTESLEAILPAAREAVNDAALTAVFDAPTETYKGRTLHGYPASDNQAFMTLMRRAVDMVDKLPPALRKKAGRITHIRYRPSFVYGGSATNSNFGTFAPDPKVSGGGTMVFQKNPAMASPAFGVIGLVQAATLSQRPDLDEEKITPQQSKILRCLMLTDAYDVAKALDMSPDILSAMSREKRDTNCN
ncbi:MAG: hypothetical protein AB7G62_05825 [Magnetospirillum sp.]